MELKDTVEMMLSEDYKERFKAEYWQLKFRLERLNRLIDSYNAGQLTIELSCPIIIHQQQACIMQRYMDLLELRAQMEEIDLPTSDDSDA